MTSNNNKRYNTIKKSTYVSAASNFVLSVIKIAIGWIGHSQALIADGIHSFTDLITDGFVFNCCKSW